MTTRSDSARSASAMRTCAPGSPLVARGHFYSDAELAGLARQAGLAQVSVHNDVAASY